MEGKQQQSLVPWLVLCPFPDQTTHSRGGLQSVHHVPHLLTGCNHPVSPLWCSGYQALPCESETGAKPTV